MKVNLEGSVLKSVAEVREFEGKQTHRVVVTVFDGEDAVKVSGRAKDEGDAQKLAAAYKPGAAVKLPIVVDVYNGRLVIRLAH